MINMFAPFGSVSKLEKTIIVIAELLIGLGIWQLFGNALIPSPIQVFSQTISIVLTNVFWSNFISSIWLTTIGMGVSIIISLILTYASFIPVFGPIAQLITKFRYLTLTGLIFVFTLLTQDGGQLKVSLLLFGIIPFFVTSLMSIFMGINSQEFELAKTLKLTPLKTLLEVVIIGRLDAALDTIRQNFAIAWLMITTVEGLSMSEGGLGVLIVKSNRVLDLQTVFALLLIIFTVGLVIDVVLKKMREWLFPYVKLGVKPS